MSTKSIEKVGIFANNKRMSYEIIKFINKNISVDQFILIKNDIGNEDLIKTLDLLLIEESQVEVFMKFYKNSFYLVSQPKIIIININNSGNSFVVGNLHKDGKIQIINMKQNISKTLEQDINNLIHHTY